MQVVVMPHNEACFGPFTDTDYRALLTVRLQTWGTSLIVTGLCVLAIVKTFKDKRIRRSVLTLFIIWKVATFYFDINGSPMCWEPYANDTPFWDEPIGTGLALATQPLAFALLALALIGLALWKWGVAFHTTFKNPKDRGN